MTVTVSDPQPVRVPYSGELIVRIGTDAVALRGVRARIFEGTKRELMARAPAQDGCVAYASRIVVSTLFRDGFGVHVTRLGSGWLNSGRDKRYVLVFEENGPVGELLRIHSRDVPMYFANAVDVIVEKADYAGPPVVQAAVQPVAAPQGSNTLKVLTTSAMNPAAATALPCARVQSGTLSVRLSIEEPCEVLPRRGWLRRMLD
jgi:hypothetical protein